MTEPPLKIIAYGAVSSAGCSTDGHWSAYTSARTTLQFDPPLSRWVGRVPAATETRLAALDASLPERTDRAARLACLAAIEAIDRAGWRGSDYGIQLGCSRGPTERWEEEYTAFIATGRAHPLTSPTTTLGSLATTVGNYLGTSGWRGAQSMTCSSGLHALIQGAALLTVGLERRLLAGGAEAPLTPFTVAQLAAPRLYTNADKNDPFPCRPLAEEPTGMVLGEGAALFALEHTTAPGLAIIAGYGYAHEFAGSATGIRPDGSALAAALRVALARAGVREVDAVVVHAPGTARGDAAELAALRNIFGNELPYLLSGKWTTGHTLGASGTLGVALAVECLQRGELLAFPYQALVSRQTFPRKVERVAVLATGFGGNAAALILTID